MIRHDSVSETVRRETESVSEKPQSFALGDHVRITAHSAPAYPRAYTERVGVIVSHAWISRQGVTRYLVDYLPLGGSGRTWVRAEHLERLIADAHQRSAAEPAPPAPAMATPHSISDVTACRSRQLNRRRGSSGSPSAPWECPVGKDPINWCDRYVRQPYPADHRYYICRECGHKGAFQARHEARHERPHHE
jgi:hypothetical protein